MSDKFEWSKEYGDQETVSRWISDCLEKLLPPKSTELISLTELSLEFCSFLSERGTERAKSLTEGERFYWADNMIRWINARWTKAIGPKRMKIDPSGEVYSVKEPEWLRKFTHVWTRTKEHPYAFKRRLV